MQQSYWKMLSDTGIYTTSDCKNQKRHIAVTTPHHHLDTAEWNTSTVKHEWNVTLQCPPLSFGHASTTRYTQLHNWMASSVPPSLLRCEDSTHVKCSSSLLRTQTIVSFSLLRCVRTLHKCSSLSTELCEDSTQVFLLPY